MELNLSLEHILQALDGQGTCSLEPSFLIKRISSLEKAGPQDLSIIVDRGDNSVFDAVSIDKIKESSAGLFLASAPLIPGKNYIIVQDAVAAFEKIVRYAERTASVHAKSVSSTEYDQVQVQEGAVVAPDAVIGKGSFIGSLAFVGKKCVIGEHVYIHPGAKILDRCVIGDHTIIHAGAVIGSDGFGYKVSRTGLQKIPQIGIVRIGKYVEIGAHCTIDRAAFDETIIGDGVKMDNGVHIAHNVKVGSHTAILAQTGIAGSTVIGMGCQIGGQVAIKDNLTIGNGAKIVSKSGVMNNLKDGEVVAGIPAIPFSQWKRQVVCMNKLPELLKQAAEFKAFFEKNQQKPSWLRKITGLFTR